MEWRGATSAKGSTEQRVACNLHVYKFYASVSRTSAGSFHYRVSGHGVPSEYGVMPVLDKDVSSGVKLQHPIILKNPSESENIKMKEIFTTKGESTTTKKNG